MADRAPATPPRDVVDGMLLEVGGWLDEPDPVRIQATVRAWDERRHVTARGIIGAHGVGAWLATDPRFRVALPGLPASFGAWLDDQADSNRLRIERLHGDLAAALGALSTAGIEVMPLKGSLLGSRSPEPARRPMADLDLLVRPGDQAAARRVLEGLGYRLRHEPTRRPTHDTFERPGELGVASFDLEHPDNPRPIELHTEVKRHLWAWADDDDLTPLLWASASPGRILGEPAMLPSDAALLNHLAIHATSDLLVRRGRLIQWLDIADLALAVLTPGAGAGGAGAGEAGAGEAGALHEFAHPRLAWPSLALAARRLPDRMRGVSLAGLEGRVPRDLAAWTATVPLSSRAGLQPRSGPPIGPSTFTARWDRWAPEPWRLAVAYGDRPLPLAFGAHLARVVRIGLAPRRGGANAAGGRPGAAAYVEDDGGA